MRKGTISLNQVPYPQGAQCQSTSEEEQASHIFYIQKSGESGDRERKVVSRCVHIIDNEERFNSVKVSNILGFQGQSMIHMAIRTRGKRVLQQSG